MGALWIQFRSCTKETRASDWGMCQEQPLGAGWSGLGDVCPAAGTQGRAQKQAEAQPALQGTEEAMDGFGEGKGVPASDGAGEVHPSVLPTAGGGGRGWLLLSAGRGGSFWSPETLPPLHGASPVPNAHGRAALSTLHSAWVPLRNRARSVPPEAAFLTSLVLSDER